AERHDHGFAVVSLTQSLHEEGPRFERRCGGPLLVGEEIDTFRWLQLGERTLVMMVVSVADPGGSVQQLLLSDAVTCAEVFREEVAIEAPDADEVLAPEGLWGGVQAVPEQGFVRLVDTPRFVRLATASGELQVLVGV